jgi:hypothetical protein
MTFPRSTIVLVDRQLTGVAKEEAPRNPDRSIVSPIAVGAFVYLIQLRTHAPGSRSRSRVSVDRDHLRGCRRKRDGGPSVGSIEGAEPEKHAIKYQHVSPCH